MGTNFSHDSGFFVTPQGSISEQFSDFEEVSSSKYTVVMKARKNGQWFVLKALAEDYRGRGQYEALLKKEYSIGFRFNHPNIVRYIDYIQVEGLGNCIQMEYIVGKRLDEFLQGAPSLKIRKRIILQIADGLKAIHAEQIVHRDLKPENIIITANDHNVKIIDFGLSDTDSYAILKEPAGTTGFSSPEQIAGDVTLDNRSDIYSFGKIMKEMNLPFYYDHVVKKCCAQDRDKRYAAIEDVSNAILYSRHKFIVEVTFIAVIITFLFVLFFVKSEGNKETIHRTNCTNVAAVSQQQSIKIETQQPTGSNEAKNANSLHLPVASIKSGSTPKTPASATSPKIVREVATSSTSSVDNLANQLHIEIDKIIDPYIAKRKAGINIAEHQTFMHIMESKADKLYKSFFERNDLDGNVTILKQEFDRYCSEKMNEYYSAGKVRDLTSQEKAEIKRRQMPQLRKFYESRKAHRDTAVARP